MNIVRFISLIVLLSISQTRGMDNLFNTSFENLIFDIKVTATCYQPTIEQCDSTPGITADGSRIDLSNPLKHRWVAVSRDILRVRHINFGDTILISGTGRYDGKWVIRDVMSKKFKNKVDFLVGDNDRIGRWEEVNVRIKLKTFSKFCF